MIEPHKPANLATLDLTAPHDPTSTFDVWQGRDSPSRLVKSSLRSEPGTSRLSGEFRPPHMVKYEVHQVSLRMFGMGEV